MDYTEIDNPEEVKKQALLSEAREKETFAFAAEMSAVEGDALAKAGAQTDVNKLNEDAAVARREADAYVKASGLSQEEIKDLHVGFLHRWIAQLEQNHVHHSAVLEVKSSLGQPTATHDSALRNLDVSHGVATNKFNELTSDNKSSDTSARRTRTRRS